MNSVVKKNRYVVDNRDGGHDDECHVDIAVRRVHDTTVRSRIDRESLVWIQPRLPHGGFDREKALGKDWLVGKEGARNGNFARFAVPFWLASFARRLASGSGGAFSSFLLGKVILHSQPSPIHSFPGGHAVGCRAVGFRVGQDISRPIRILSHPLESLWNVGVSHTFPVLFDDDLHHLGYVEENLSKKNRGCLSAFPSRWIPWYRSTQTSGQR